MPHSYVGKSKLYNAIIQVFNILSVLMLNVLFSVLGEPLITTNKNLEQISPALGYLYA